MVDLIDLCALSADLDRFLFKLKISITDPGTLHNGSCKPAFNGNALSGHFDHIHIDRCGAALYDGQIIGHCARQTGIIVERIMPFAGDLGGGLNRNFDVASVHLGDGRSRPLQLQADRDF